MYAIKSKRDPEILRLLEQAGAKFDKQKALELAVKESNIAVVRVLIQNGADINAMDSNGITLYIKKAGEYGETSFLNDLKNAGAKFNGPEEMNTALNDDNVELLNALMRMRTITVNLRRCLEVAKKPLTKKVLEDAIRSRPLLTEEEIISVAEKYDFEIIPDTFFTAKERYFTIDGSEYRIIASDTHNKSMGQVYFLEDRIVWREGYIIYNF